MEQLDVSSETPLQLAVVSVVPFAPDELPSFSPTSLIMRIRQALTVDPLALETFDLKLGAAGYADDLIYQETRFSITRYKDSIALQKAFRV